MAKTKFEVYKDGKGNYRWRLLAQNGEPVASSGEGFSEKRTAMNAVKKLKDWSNTENIVDLEKMKEEAMKLKSAKKPVAKDSSKPAKKTVSKSAVKPATKAVPKKAAAKKPVAKAAPKSNTVEAKEVIVSKTVL